MNWKCTNLLVGIILLSGLATAIACTAAIPDPTPSPYPTYTPYPTWTPAPITTSLPTYTPAPPLPTYTRYPTNTPYPTWTPIPAPTATPTPRPTRTLIPTITLRPTSTPRPTAHAKIRQTLGCRDCVFVLPSLGVNNPDIQRFIDWPATSRHPDPFIVAACGTGQSLDDKNRTQVVAHPNLGSKRATVSNVILINTTTDFPDKQCFAARVEYTGFTLVEWTETSRVTLSSGVQLLPVVQNYDVDHVTFDKPTERIDISTADFTSLLLEEVP